MACDQGLCCAPPGSRTQNLRIKSPEQPVRPVLRSPQNAGFVRLAVQGVLPNPPQSGEFVAKLVARLRQPWRRRCRPLCLVAASSCQRSVVIASSSDTIVMDIGTPELDGLEVVNVPPAWLAIAGESLAATRRTLQ